MQVKSKLQNTHNPLKPVLVYEVSIFRIDVMCSLLLNNDRMMPTNLIVWIFTKPCGANVSLQKFSKNLY